MLKKKQKKENFDFLKEKDPLRYCIHTYCHGVIINNSNITSSGNKYKDYTILKAAKIEFKLAPPGVVMFSKYNGKTDAKIMYCKVKKEYANIIGYVTF